MAGTRPLGDDAGGSLAVKWIPVRVKHVCFLACLWGAIWLLGSLGMGHPLFDGWKFVGMVSICARIGFLAAWTFITYFNHSHWWNEFLAPDPDRTWPRIHRAMAFLLGGRHRWNGMFFHDVHHMSPGRIGANIPLQATHGPTLEAMRVELATALAQSRYDVKEDMAALRNRI